MKATLTEQQQTMAEKSSFFVHFSFLLLLLSIITTCGEGVRDPVRRSSERRALMDGQDLSRPLKLTFGGPSRNWTDAIPIGNGRLGATIWGGVSSETLNINGKCLKRRRFWICPFSPIHVFGDLGNKCYYLLFSGTIYCQRSINVLVSWPNLLTL